MRNAIVQFNIDPGLYLTNSKKTLINKTNEYIFDYSKKSLNLYCNKYGIDYIIITEPRVNYEHPTWERLDLWFNESWFEKYDNICYMDTDIFIMPWAENIFEQITDNKYFHRIPYWKANRKLNENDLFYSLDHERVKQCLFQAGVILLSKEIINSTKPIVNRYREAIFTDDSVLLNYAIISSNIKVKNIKENFNVKLTQDLTISNVNFLHAFGRLKDTNPQWVINLLRNIYD